jgi:hypothetical protein
VTDSEIGNSDIYRRVTMWFMILLSTRNRLLLPIQSVLMAMQDVHGPDAHFICAAREVFVGTHDNYSANWRMATKRNIPVHLKYAVYLKRSGCLNELSLKDQIICPMRLNKHRDEMLKSANLLDELSDVCDISQLLLSIRVISNCGNIKEELLKTVSLYGENRGQDTFRNF